MTAYSPLTIRLFKIENGNWYFSFSDSIESSSLRMDALSEIKAPQKIKDTAFVRALVLGKASLYYLKDRNEREHFLLQKNGGSIVELYYKKYLYISDNGTFTGDVPTYKGQLIQSLSDCEAITSTMATLALDYSAKDLSSLIKDYDKCVGSAIIYAETKEKWKFKISPEVGVNVSKLSSKSSDKSLILNGWIFGPELGYVAGIGFDAIIPRNRGKWSIYNEAMVRNFKSTNSDYKPPLEVKFDVIYFKIASTIRYHFVNGEVHPFLEVGMTNAFALKDSDPANFNYTNYNANDYSFVGAFRKYEQGVTTGFGAIYKSFSFQSLLEISNGMSQITGLKTIFKTGYFEVGYIF